VTLRSYDTYDESDLAKAGRTAADLIDLLARLDKNRIAVGKLVSGTPGHMTLAKDIKVEVEQKTPGDDVTMTLTLRSHGDGANPGKPLAYYREFQEFADAIQHGSGSVQVLGKRLHGTTVDSDDSPIIAFTLTQAQSPKLAEKVQEMAARVTALTNKAGIYRITRGI